MRRLKKVFDVGMLGLAVIGMGGVLYCAHSTYGKVGMDVTLATLVLAAVGCFGWCIALTEYAKYGTVSW